MAKKIFYEKKGRRYVPIAEYDNDFIDSFSKGNHLVMCYPGGTSRRFNINPDYAAMIAAGRVAEDAISKVIMKATELRGDSRKEIPLTPGQIAAWENLVKEFGDSAKALEWPSAREASEAAIKAMQEEADKLLANPSVKKAWDYFHMVCDLTREDSKQS